ncbi:MAG TPA: hypothetical protein VJV78_07185, partial [Polyangiales bacterium]|nr:hypothetical protein [Polyangiales bacterium]
MSTHIVRSIQVSRVLSVLGTSLLALAGCGPETDSGVRAMTAGAGAATTAETRGAAGRGTTAGFGSGTIAGMSGAAGAGASAGVPAAGVG